VRVKCFAEPLRPTYTPAYTARPRVVLADLLFYLLRVTGYVFEEISPTQGATVNQIRTLQSVYSHKYTVHCTSSRHDRSQSSI